MSDQLRQMLMSAESLVALLATVEPDDGCGAIMPDGVTHTVSTFGASVLRVSTLPCGEVEIELHMTHAPEQASALLAEFRQVVAAWVPARHDDRAAFLGGDAGDGYGVIII